MLNWFAAYYRPGTLTVGHDGWVESCKYNHTGLRATIRFAGKRDCPATVIAVLEPGKGYTGNCTLRERQPGTFELTVPAGADLVEVVIRT